MSKVRPMAEPDGVASSHLTTTLFVVSFLLGLIAQALF